MDKVWKKIGSGILSIVFSSLLFIGAKDIPNRQKLQIDSAMFPRLIAILFLVVGIPMLIGGLVEFSKQKKTVNNNTNDKVKCKSMSDSILPVGAFLLVVVFVLLLKPFGTMIAGAVYLISTFFLICPKEKRNIPVMVIISVCVPVFIYFLFTKAFHMTLPTGTIFR